MGDPSRSQSPKSSYGILGIPKSASLSDIGKAYRSLVIKWHPDRNPSNKAEAEAKFSSINEAYRALSMKKREEDIACNGGDHKPKTHKKKKSHGEKDDNAELQISKPTLLSRTTSRISPLISPIMPSISSRTDFSGGNTPTTPTTPPPPHFSKAASSRRCATPIFFSQSAARRKPPPIEKKIECTLEELCLGCVKKIKVTRDAISASGVQTRGQRFGAGGRDSSRTGSHRMHYSYPAIRRWPNKPETQVLDRVSS